MARIPLEQRRGEEDRSVDLVSVMHVFLERIAPAFATATPNVRERVTRQAEVERVVLP